MAKCRYCGEFEGTIEIDNPNFNEEDTWIVCPTCDRVIKEQQGLSMAVFLKHRAKECGLTGFDKKMDKQIEKHNKELEYLSKKSGMPIVSAVFTKKKK